MSNMTRINHDEYIPGLRDLCRVIEEEGSIPAIQLVHGGRQAIPTDDAKELVAPSPIPCPVRQIVPRELSVEEIERIEDDFVDGTVRAKKAGAKMVELHGAHGYLINQFFSKVTSEGFKPGCQPCPALKLAGSWFESRCLAGPSWS